MPIQTATVATALLKNKKEVFSILKGIKEEIINTFDIGLSKYIADREDKISKINTFLSRTEKLDFYDVYFPLRLTFKNNIISSNLLLKNLFSNSNSAAIIGVAGSGKTMLMKHVFLSCKNELFKIPIFVELRDFNNLDVNLIDYIYSTVLENKIKPSTKIFERALTSGKFIFLFDGYDELSFEKKSTITADIEKFIDLHSKNHFLFSSRPGTNIESFPRMNTFRVQPLDKKEIEVFIDIQLKSSEDPMLCVKLKETIRDKKNKEYIDYVTNPLLLSMFILTFGSHPELPKYKHKFYWNVFDTLCTMHDSVSKKGGYTHLKKSKFQDQDFENILKYFCVSSLLENRFKFDKEYLSEKLKTVIAKLGLKCNIEDLLYDLVVSISILIQEGLEYKFPHRTMQDYFAALFIKEQNDTSKQKIYSEKIVKNLNEVDSNISFFDLCQELDKDSFYEFYLIPIFDEFNRTYSEKSIDIRISKLFNNLEISYILDYGEKFQRMQIKDIYIKSTLSVNILSFFGMDYIKIFLFKYMHLRETEYRKHSENGILLSLIPLMDIDVSHQYKHFDDSVTYNLNFRKLKKTQIINVLTKLGVKQQIESYLTFMKNKELELKAELARDKENKIAIWDI